MEDTSKYRVDCPLCRDKDKRIQELEEALKNIAATISNDNVYMTRILYDLKIGTP